jgi:hypothetical protein
MIKAWRSRDFIDQHAGELTSDAPCQDCLRVARAVMYGRSGMLEELACADIQTARRRIREAGDLVKKTTGDFIK